MVIGLLPTSYLFLKDHAIRLAFGGADASNFILNPNPPPVVVVHRSSTYASHLELPVMER